ncbi:hypothetical protein [Neolewinella maritima]|nr:hypothetical protein [Neolewinella maritima]
MAKTMSLGNWCLNGQAIVLSDDATLLDGQHRLMAVIESKCDVLFDVRFGVPNAAMLTIDEGKKRNAADVLQIQGLKNSTTVAAAAKRVMRYDAALVATNSGDRSINATNQEVAAWVAQNPGIVDVAAQAHKHYAMVSDSPLSSGYLAAFTFICNRLDRSLAADFYFRLATGAGLEIDSVVFMLRNRLNQARNNSTLKFSPAYITGLVVTAWNHEREGNSVRQLRYTDRKGIVPEFK